MFYQRKTTGRNSLPTPFGQEPINGGTPLSTMQKIPAAHSRWSQDPCVILVCASFMIHPHIQSKPTFRSDLEIKSYASTCVPRCAKLLQWRTGAACSQTHPSQQIAMMVFSTQPASTLFFKPARSAIFHLHLLRRVFSSADDSPTSALTAMPASWPPPQIRTQCS